MMIPLSVACMVPGGEFVENQDLPCTVISFVVDQDLVDDAILDRLF